MHYTGLLTVQFIQIAIAIATDYVYVSFHNAKNYTLVMQYQTVYVPEAFSTARVGYWNSVSNSVVSFWLKFGERAFSIASPRAWNSLPAYLRATVNTGTFKKKLKTFLFILQILFNSPLNLYFVVL